MNKKVIFYLLSLICSGEIVGMLVALLLGVAHGESPWPWITAIIIAMLFGWGLKMFSAGSLPSDITIREGIGGVFFSWVLACTLSALPFIFHGVLGTVDAIFESMSGLTTTGASVIDDLNAVPVSILLWRSMLHWSGGIGIIVIFVALLPQIAGGAMHLFKAEASGFATSRILPRIQTTALVTFGIYTGFTLILMLLLWLSGMTLFDAVNHSLSTIATGGFSTHNESVAYFSSPLIESILTIFMLIAGGNFALYFQVYQSGIRVLLRDVEFRAYMGFAVSAIVLITINICYVNGYNILDGFRYAAFQAASFVSTTGYVSFDYDQWPGFSKLLLALMYLTGGCAGSTAGGIKFCRFVVLLKAVGAELRRAMHPQMILNVQYAKMPINAPTIINISRFFFLYIFIIALLSFVLSWSGLPVEESIFGVASCLSSVGPAFGSLGATHNFSVVSPLGKLVLSLAMLLGRLELFTALVLLRSEYWRSSKRW